MGSMTDSSHIQSLLFATVALKSGDMAKTNWLTDEEMRLWRAFITAYSGMGSAVDASLKRTNGMNLDDYEVLVLLSESESQRLRMSELSTSILHSRSRLTQRVDRLEKRGFVSRAKVDADARGTWAVLTDDGHAALAAAAPSHLQHVREYFFDHIEDEDMPAMTRSLEQVAEQLRS